MLFATTRIRPLSWRGTSIWTYFELLRPMRSRKPDSLARSPANPPGPPPVRCSNGDAQSIGFFRADQCAATVPASTVRSWRRITIRSLYSWRLSDTANHGARGCVCIATCQSLGIMPLERLFHHQAETPHFSFHQLLNWSSLLQIEWP